MTIHRGRSTPHKLISLFWLSEADAHLQWVNYVSGAREPTLSVKLTKRTNKINECVTNIQTITGSQWNLINNNLLSKRGVDPKIQ